MRSPLTALRAKFRRTVTGGLLLREIRGMRLALAAQTNQLTQIARELQRRNDHDFGAVVQPNPDLPPVEVSYADDLYGMRIADIVSRLTLAKGMPPTDDEAFEEYCRSYPDSPEALETRREEQTYSSLPWGEA